MRVLVAHNRYRSDLPSGENTVVDSEIQALRESGVEVEAVLPSSDDISTYGLIRRARLPLAPFTGWPALGDFERRLEAFRPDVVHVHNLYPLLSPGVIRASARRGVPVVASVHNFRRSCLNGILFREGAPCHLCEEKRSSLPGVWHGCYRDSQLQSAVMAGAGRFHEQTWSGVRRFICVSEYMAAWLTGRGVDPQMISVKPNSVKDPGLASDDGRGFLFAGRLAEAKGVQLLLDAWSSAEMPDDQCLFFAGSGPLESAVAAAERVDPRVRLLGQLSESDLVALRRRAAVAVVPSISPESFGMGVVESYAVGRPVVATGVGALSELVDESVGWLVEPNRDALRVAMVSALDTGEVNRRGGAARERYSMRFRSERVARRLTEIYELVLSS